MSTPIIDRDLSKQAPHSPRERIDGFAIASRTVDKCRASMAGMLGEYHYDCPLDNVLFSFNGITGEQFKAPFELRRLTKISGAGCNPTAQRGRRLRSRPGRTELRLKA